MNNEYDSRDRLNGDIEDILAISGVDLGVESEETFPLPRIEGVALAARDGPISYRDSLTKEELEKAPASEDVLIGIRDNDRFVKISIFPIVDILMERTGRSVPMGDNSIVGFEYFDYEEKKGKIKKIFALIIDDSEDDNFIMLRTPSEVQEAWDKSSYWAREDLEAFSNLPKREIISRFIEYTERYI